MTTAICYKSRIDACFGTRVAMTSLIIMKIKFVYFQKNDVNGLRVGSRIGSYDYRSCDHGITIVFFFGVSSNKQIVIKSYLQLDKKPSNPTRERRKKPVLL